MCSVVVVNATEMPTALTLKDRISVSVEKDMLATDSTVDVRSGFIVHYFQSRILCLLTS